MFGEALAATRQLANLRRHAALVLGSRQAADEHLARLLEGLTELDYRRASSDHAALFAQFHALPPDPPPAAPVLSDFLPAARPYVAALHKMAISERSALLLGVQQRFALPQIGRILALAEQEVAPCLLRARFLIDAGLGGRICMIVEDDLITLRDLQDEAVSHGLFVAGTAKSRGEAYRLLEQFKPDIGIIDLALPEGVHAGMDVAAQLRDCCQSRIIYVTAFAKTVRELAHPHDVIIDKPWSASKLKSALMSAAA